MDLSVFLELQKLLLSNEFVTEAEIRNLQPQLSGKNENSTDESEIGETYLEELIDSEFTKYCETGVGACKTEEGDSSSNSFVTVDIQRHIEDVKSQRSAVNEECPRDNEDDLNLQEIIAEELSLALEIGVEAFETDEGNSSANSSVIDDILMGDIEDVKSSRSTANEDNSNDSEDDINLDNIFAEELSKAFDSYFEEEENNKQNKATAKVEFDCSICMDTSLIKDSDHFGCKHRYCKTCLINFLLSKFEKNQVNGITCPTESCASIAQDKWIRSILPSNLIANYDKIIFRTIGGQIEDIMYCPQCNESVECDLATASGLCSSCGYLFCTSCIKAFHGTNDCEHIQRRNEDNEKSELLINTQFKKCPKCQVNIEKDFGCYHMQCSLCNIDFCWRCMEIINDVGSHYRTKCILFDYDMVKE